MCELHVVYLYIIYFYGYCMCMLHENVYCYFRMNYVNLQNVWVCLKFIYVYEVL